LYGIKYLLGHNIAFNGIIIAVLVPMWTHLHPDKIGILKIHQTINIEKEGDLKLLDRILSRSWQDKAEILGQS
jgi:hypothetical protein